MVSLENSLGNRMENQSNPVGESWAMLRKSKKPLSKSLGVGLGILQGISGNP